MTNNPNWIQRLAESETAEPSSFTAFEEERIIPFLLDYPQHAAKHLDSLLRPEIYQLLEVQYVVAWITKIHKATGTITTRELLINEVAKHITVDHPHERIMAICERRLKPVEAVAIKELLNTFIKQKLFGRLYSDEAIAAYHQGDYEMLKTIWDAAYGASTAESRFGNVLDGQQILELELPPEKWLIEGLVEAEGLLVIGGPLKSLKSSIVLDMAFGLATGTKVLGKYRVPEPKKIVLITAETSKRAIQAKLAKLVAKHKPHPELLANFAWHSTAAKLTDPEYMADLEAYLLANRPTICIIDPMYVSMGDTESSAVSAVGRVLADYAALCERHDCLAAIVHHFNRKGQPGARPGLLDLTGAGCAENCRQWILLKHRLPYKPEHPHNMWMVTGSSNCRADAYIATIDETKWSVHLDEAGEIEQTEKKHKNDGAINELLDAVSRLKDDGPEARTLNKLAQFLGKGKESVRTLLSRAVDGGMLEETEVVVHGNKTLSWGVVGNRSDHPSDHPPSET
jgi:RecA-family ATPase